MTPQEFIAKWHAVELKERSASQAHFIDLCRLLGVKDPISDDPKGEFFAFEKGASKTSGGEGWADVWRKNCFAWEYKGKAKDLDKAFAQLQQYAIALENPPLLIVSDMDRKRNGLEPKNEELAFLKATDGINISQPWSRLLQRNSPRLRSSSLRSEVGKVPGRHSISSRRFFCRSPV